MFGMVDVSWCSFGYIFFILLIISEFEAIGLVQLLWLMSWYDSVDMARLRLVKNGGRQGKDWDNDSLVVYLDGPPRRHRARVGLLIKKEVREVSGDGGGRTAITPAL